MNGVSSRIAAVRVVGDTICLLQISSGDASATRRSRIRHGGAGARSSRRLASNIRHGDLTSTPGDWGSPRLECVRTRTLTPWPAAGQLRGGHVATMRC